jgi:hypothetical protein
LKQIVWKGVFAFSLIITLAIMLLLFSILSSALIIGGCFPSEYPLSDKNTPECIQVEQNHCIGRPIITNNCGETYLLSVKDFNSNYLNDYIIEQGLKANETGILLSQGESILLPPLNIDPNKTPPWSLTVTDETNQKVYFIDGKVNSALIEKNNFQKTLIQNYFVFVLGLIVFLGITIIAYRNQKQLKSDSTKQSKKR